MPYEGAVNLNFTVVDDLYENTAAWPDTLGFTFGANAAINIPCTVYINSGL